MDIQKDASVIVLLAHPSAFGLCELKSLQKYVARQVYRICYLFGIQTNKQPINILINAILTAIDIYITVYKVTLYTYIKFKIFVKI